MSMTSQAMDVEETQLPVHVLVLIENSGQMRDHWHYLRRELLPGVFGALRWANREKQIVIFHNTTSAATVNQPFLIHNENDDFPDVDFVDNPTNIFTPQMLRASVNELIRRGGGQQGIVRHLVVVAVSRVVPDALLTTSSGAPLHPSHPDRWSSIGNYLLQNNIICHVILNPGAAVGPLYNAFIYTLGLQGRQELTPWVSPNATLCKCYMSGSPLAPRNAEPYAAHIWLESTIMRRSPRGPHLFGAAQQTQQPGLTSVASSASSAVGQEIPPASSSQTSSSEEGLSLVTELRAMYRISPKHGPTPSRSGSTSDSRRVKRSTRPSAGGSSMPPPPTVPNKRRRSNEEVAGATHSSRPAEMQPMNSQPIDLSGQPIGPGSSWMGSDPTVNAPIASGSLSSPQPPYPMSSQYFASAPVPAYASSSLPPHLRATLTTQGAAIGQPPSSTLYQQPEMHRALERQSQASLQPTPMGGAFISAPAQIHTPQAQTPAWQAPMSYQRPQAGGSAGPSDAYNYALASSLPMINTQRNLPQISIGGSSVQTPQYSLQQDSTTSVSIFPSTVAKSKHEQKKPAPKSPGDEPFVPFTPEEEAIIEENFRRVKEQWEREKRMSATSTNPVRDPAFPIMGPPGYNYNLPPFNESPEYRRSFAGEPSYPPQSDHIDDPSQHRG